MAEENKTLRKRNGQLLIELEEAKAALVGVEKHTLSEKKA